MAVVRAPPQVRRWCFTLNNYDLHLNYKELFRNPIFNINRVVWGREVAPITGTAHMQGYVEMFRTYRFSHMKAILPTAYWEIARGTAKQIFHYCTKGNDYDTIGNWTKEMNASGEPS